MALAFSNVLRYQPPMANESIDKLARKLVETLPEGLRSVRDDLEKNFRSVLQSGLNRLDLVTREEFEVQQAVLVRTREKLDALDARLAGFEAKKKTQNKPAKKKASKKKASNKKGS